MINEELLNFTNKLNEYAKNYHKEKEYITDDDLILAIYYLNNLNITNAGDCLTYLSALNLCNSYVKQSEVKISYRFKKGIKYLIDILNNQIINDIYITQTSNNGNLYIFKIGNIQFSFHDEKKIIILDTYHKEMIWDGIRKQPCSVSLFKMCMNENIVSNNKTFKNENIKEKAYELLNDYHQNKVTLEEILDLEF